MVYYLVIPLAWQFFLSFEINPGQGALPVRPEVQRANIAILTSVMGVSVLVYTLIAGDVTRDIINKLVIFAVPYGLGIWAGTKMFHILPENSFKKIVLWFLLLFCIAILVV